MSKAFSNAKKGELFELKAELNSQSNSTRKEAVRKTIASMTIGRDVSGLFTDVLNCMQSPNIEIKKLVYLYIVNYAHTKPDLAILAVNSFVRDSEDPNPLLRALAIRTMACIRVDKIVEYLLEPLQRTLHDQDPYVRKTAAVCVAKLHAMNPELVQDQGMLDSLLDLLTDGNPMVVSNAVASLMDIAEYRPDFFKIDSPLVMKLLHALNECNEWGQVLLLDALAEYNPRNHDEADAIVERVTSRLQHANGAVVLAATRIVIANAEKLSSDEKRMNSLKKLTAPLISLLSANGEFQYVALRSIRIINQKYSFLFQNDVRVFFCKYNDPLYVKFEKVELLIALLDESNSSIVLQEMNEYASEVDMDFVKKSIEGIGRIALAHEASADKCVELLVALLKAGHDGVTDQAVVVLKNIFRSYPQRYLSVVEVICNNCESIGEPDAKASMIWIFGEYAEHIPQVVELLGELMEGFSTEPVSVQLQLLSAAVKVYLARGHEGKGLLESALRLSTKETYSTDLRDRGYAYSRLLSCGDEVARKVVMNERPAVSDTRGEMSADLQADLSRNMGKMSSLLMRKSASLRSPTAPPVLTVRDSDNLLSMGNDELLMIDDGPTDAIQGRENGSEQFLGTDDLIGALPSVANGSQPPQKDAKAGNLLDELFGAPVAPATAPARAQPLPPVDDILSLPATQPQKKILDRDISALGVGGGVEPADTLPSTQRNSLPVAGLSANSTAGENKNQLTKVLGAEKGKGLIVFAELRSIDDSLFLEMEFQNTLQAPMEGFAAQFNKNAFGIVPASALSLSEPLQALKSEVVLVPLKFGGEVDPQKGAMLQLAIKCEPCGVLYMIYDVGKHLDALFSPNGAVAKQEFLQLWGQTLDQSEVLRPVSMAPFREDQELIEKLHNAKVFFTAKRGGQGGALFVSYFAARVEGAQKQFLIELTVNSRTAANCAVRPVGDCPQALVASMAMTVEKILADSG
uniref:AP complex subunit beta n=2 Tax=Rhodosorus marinus TaxID=101924 RepID=A0A7S2ZXZ8_9RHOD|mmetsp:Transcript_36090/g.144298  ORF Transcript_36090/g.144298 Transcript_36090/m.144298 type:complete len:973 (+) Transcript_36090:255-3173(+)|eukprot:CAMPEP_0113960716 /NCGR_PEP_ID=MMETSP0011_2-20120614/4880_1 /TAXON_ID=101924 /ORGANISM="Rhodosorus marinus" /LENGTH=972 /DNA_ID=CAMNT_0000972221 /DNA_START=133 /DNA_END=3051 /DNA_ORIENTATION=- /assembly_acc=CAM_ASM_000156